MRTDGTLIAVPREWWHEPAVDDLRRAGFGPVGYDTADLHRGPHWTGGRLAEVVALAADQPVPAALVAGLPRLRVVSFGGTGVWDLIDVEHAARHGVAVCNVRDYATAAVAEHTMALILAVTKRINAADTLVRTGRWSDGRPWAGQLSGRVLGLIGLGAIGARVARLAAAHGMTVECWTRTADPAREAALGVRRRELDELLGRADVVSLHLLLTPQTAGLLDARRIGLMKRGALVVNTARGGLIDHDALVTAIGDGRLGGAGLDVFDPEPPPADHPLLRLRQVVLTPHVGASTVEARRAAIEGCLHNIVSFLAGAPTNVVEAMAPAGEQA